MNLGCWTIGPHAQPNDQVPVTASSCRLTCAVSGWSGQPAE
jgi:hypothetical protein